MNRIAILVFALALPAMAQAGAEWKAPPDAAAKENPLKSKPQLAAGGKKVFAKTCASCHDSGPDQKGPHLSRPQTQSQTDGELFWKITNGNTRTGMPGWSSLPDGQRWQLVLYIRSLAPHDNK